MKDGDGATPLHFAASRGHVDVVRWLLSKGARVTLDNFGKSPLNDAAENEQLEVGSMIPLTLFIRTIIGDWFLWFDCHKSPRWDLVEPGWSRGANSTNNFLSLSYSI